MRIWVTPLLVLTLVAANARCDIVNWTNTAGGDWSATNNWSPHRIPGSLDTAVITNSGNYAISINSDATVGNLLLGSSDVSSTQSLSINAGTCTLDGLATVNPSGQFNVNGGMLSGSPASGTATINGTVTFSSGAMSGTLTVASNSVLNLTNSGASSSLLLTVLVLTNYGTVVWSNVDLHDTFSPQIDNYGLWEAQTDNTVYGNLNAPYGTGPTVFNNYGIFRKSGGNHSDLDSNVTFNNYSTVDVQSGTLEIDGSGWDTGSVNTAFGTSFLLQGLGFALTGNPTFTGSGSIEGNLISSNAVLHGTVTLNYSSTYYGALSGTLLTVASNAVLNLTASNASSALVVSALVLTNYGTVVWSNVDLHDTFSPQIDNYGLWEAQTDNTVYGNLNAPYGTGPTVFNNYGIFRKSGGNHSDLDSNVTFNNYGTVDVQSGVLEIDGTNTLAGGTLSFGINNSSDFGSINLPGNVALAGALSVNFNNGFSPVAGDSFTLLTYGAETGTFANLNLPPLPLALLWQENYGATAFTLNVATAPPLQLTQVTIQNGTNFSFAWNAAYGQTYQLQSTTNLASTNWIHLGGTISGTNGTMTLSKRIGPNMERFYRLVLLPSQ